MFTTTRKLTVLALVAVAALSAESVEAGYGPSQSRISSRQSGYGSSRVGYRSSKIRHQAPRQSCDSQQSNYRSHSSRQRFDNGDQYQSKPQYHAPAPRCRYKTVIDWEIQRIPQVKWVVVHDHYGNQRKIKQVHYKQVRVPVKRQVKVCDKY